MTTWDGDRYQERFDTLAAGGMNVHGEADFVMRFAPRDVLDAGCGTGRVAIELSRRGIDVVGVDLDGSMLATARAQAPSLTFLQHDLADLDLGRRFDVVVMAGNIVLFTAPGAQAAVVKGCARHVRADGVLIAGFQLGRGYDLGSYDEACAAAGLSCVARYATWSGDPFGNNDYAVSVHRPGNRSVTGRERHDEI